MKKLLVFISTLLMMAMILSACTSTPATSTDTIPVPSSVPTPTGVPISTLRAAILEDISSTNVWSLFDEGGASFWNHAVEGSYWPTLYGLSAQRFDLIPNAARDLPGVFSQEGDFFVAAINLKEGLKWNDGSTVTAEDVVFTINTVLKFKLSMNWKMYYDPAFLDHVEAIDLLTVKLFFLQMPGLAKWQYGALQGYFVNKAYWEPKIVDALATLGDGTNEEMRLAAVNQLETLDASAEPTFGPYTLNQWTVNTSVSNIHNIGNFFNGIIVEEYANGAYRERKPDGSYDWIVNGTATGDLLLQYVVDPFETISFTVYDNDQAYLALRNNTVDMVINPSGMGIGTASHLQMDSNIQIVPNAQNGTAFVAFNQNHEIFIGEKGLSLRKTLACLLDLKALARELLQNQVKPAYTLVPSANTFWTNPSVYKYCDGFSTEERYAQAVQFMVLKQFKWVDQIPWYNAKAPPGSNLFAGKGLTLPDGSKFPTLTLVAPKSSSNPLLAATAEYIALEMRNLDIQVEVQYLTIDELITTIYKTGDYDLALLNLGFTFYPSYLCSIFNDGLQPNPFGYQSTLLNEKCNALIMEDDTNQAKDIAFDIQNLLAEDIPFITLYSPTIIDAYRNFSAQFTTSIDGLNMIYIPHPIQQVITFR